MNPIAILALLSELYSQVQQQQDRIKELEAELQAGDPDAS